MELVYSTLQDHLDIFVPPERVPPTNTPLESPAISSVPPLTVPPVQKEAPEVLAPPALKVEMSFCPRIKDTMTLPSLPTSEIRVPAAALPEVLTLAELANESPITLP